jgi:hypothetical protein
MVLPRGNRILFRQRLVAVRANDCLMRACQHEPCLLMLRQRECGWMEVRLCMTRFAFIGVRGSGKLRTVRIGMAALAGRGPKLESCVRTRRFVAGLTLGSLMLAFQTKCVLVHVARVDGGLELLFIVAG